MPGGEVKQEDNMLFKGNMMRSFSKALLIAIFLLFGMAITACAAPKAELWPRWQTNDPQSNIIVDHSLWADFLGTYLTVGKAGDITLVRYAAVTPKDKASLGNYLKLLSATSTAKLNRDEQKAFWINLYNALTVQTILNHYPVQSIKDIGTGWFSSGPWDLKLVKVEGIELSLNEIEHRILRPIWQDNRVHYAVNCASLGCPNLQSVPFTASNTEELLDQAARDYINHPRGAQLVGNKLTASSIYDWFQIDFGGNEAGVIAHLRLYAAAELAAALDERSAIDVYDYNWQLNN